MSTANKKSCNEIWKSLYNSTPLILNKVPNGLYTVDLVEIKYNEEEEIIEWIFTIVQGPHESKTIKRVDYLEDGDQILFTFNDFQKCMIEFENIHDINIKEIHDEELSMIVLEVEVEDSEVKICKRIQ